MGWYRIDAQDGSRSPESRDRVLRVVAANYGGAANAQELVEGCERRATPALNAGIRCQFALYEYEAE